MDDRLVWADRLVRAMASEKCLNPVDPEDGTSPIDCGEVYLCGGICAVCAARRYVERHPEKVAETVR